MSSVRNDIVKDLVTSLEGVQGGGGYHYDLKRVFRGRAPDMPEVPSALVLSVSDEVEEGASAIHHRTLTVEIHVLHEVPYTIADNPDEVAAFLVADVERCVKVDERRSGNATNTRVIRSDSLVDFPVEEQVVVIIVLEIDYRTDLYDPAKAR